MGYSSTILECKLITNTWQGDNTMSYSSTILECKWRITRGLFKTNNGVIVAPYWNVNLICPCATVIAVVVIVDVSI